MPVPVPVPVPVPQCMTLFMNVPLAFVLHPPGLSLKKSFYSCSNAVIQNWGQVSPDTSRNIKKNVKYTLNVVWK